MTRIRFRQPLDFAQNLFNNPELDRAGGAVGEFFPN